MHAGGGGDPDTSPGRRGAFSLSRLAALLAGFLAFLLLAALDTPLKHVTSPDGATSYGARPAFAAGAVVLMAIWWVTEALPIHWTALVPLFCFPILDIFGRGALAGLQRTALPYIDAYIFLFLGGMCIAAAMQEWNLHRRIALTIMRAIGAEPSRLLLGFVLATGLVSMWISNTATAAMMFPIGMAVIAQLERQSGGRRLAGFGAAIMLAIAYGANVGGIGTKIGTAPNALFCGFLAQNLGVEVSFVRYLGVGLPFVVIFLPIVWWWLWRQLGRSDAPPGAAGRATLDAELAALGPPKPAEKMVLAVFVTAAILWIFSGPITRELTPYLRTLAPGVRSWSKYVEAATAMLAALILLVVPVRGRPALSLGQLRHMPWQTLVLLGGGFSMAAGVEASGLSTWMSAQLAGMREQSPLIQVAIASYSSVLLSAVASNTATVSVMLNVLTSAATPGSVLPVLSASTMAASCDFALPAGTPPNAIVFGSGYLTIPRMAKVGIVLDLMAAALVTAWCAAGVRVLFR
jgi:sodium-dependent dicarboxylate transporter 2/3/5